MGYNKYYEKLNSLSADKYNATLEAIKKIKEEISKCECSKKAYGAFFSHTADVIISLSEHEAELTEEYFTENSFEVLLKKNHELYKHVANEAYDKSYANPKYCVEIFGEAGQSMCYLYMIYTNYIAYAYKHKRFQMAKFNQLFIDAFELVKCGNEWTMEELKALVVREAVKCDQESIERNLSERFSPEANFFVDIIKSTDLNDLRYLFRYGNYITENEIKTAEFYNNYSQDKIEQIAKVYTEGFKNGFDRDAKDMSIKDNVKLIFKAGQEQMIKVAIAKFEAMGLTTMVDDVAGTEASKQMSYDHRFDIGLYLTEEIKDKLIETYSKVLEKCGKALSVYAGPAVVETFGEKPFSPESKSECIKLDEQQSQYFNEYQGRNQQEMSKYAPRSEYSFTIIAFPVPEIGDNFEEIFEDTCEVNMLDSDKYERIQQHIIDALDKGDTVHIKGKGSNETDVIVKNQKINNPEKETNYVNCVADVNIPVGEVFTSPQLTGTNGILHVEEVYLRDLKYENLKIEFKDGYVHEYTCTNFDNEEDNKKYIQENLMFPHKTLPLGEFAIGTNTTAYVMANKHDILNIMPILIVEKMGPHFAIGDTCFSWSEDTAVHNPLDGKEIIARDNEKSILRKTNPQEAYTQCHTDITLPYSGIEFIKSISESGDEIEIIRDCKFVLSGTEELNEAFDK